MKQMRRLVLMLVLVLINLLLLGNLAAVQAEGADLTVYVSCATPQEDGSILVWFGYNASATADSSSFGYIDDGPGIYADGVEAGKHDRVAEAILSPDEAQIMFYADGWYGEDYVYSEAWFDASMSAPACDDSGGDEQPVTLDDQGVVNNPYMNDRANTCYDPGQVCTTEDDWVRGYYLIREQYGMP